jgi:large conductance mechanosensitive channel
MKLSFKQMMAEFKAFAFKGNMLDLAVAVVIGAAFGGVINSLVSDIIMPGLSYVTTAATAAKDAATNAAEKAGHAMGVSTSQPATTQAATEPAAAAPAPPPPPPPAPAAAPKDAKAVDFSWKIGRFEVGKFVASLLNFVLIAFAVFLCVVKFLGSVMKKVGGTPAPSEPTTKECPKCLSVIPLKASKCAHCTADLPPA